MGLNQSMVIAAIYPENMSASQVKVLEFRKFFQLHELLGFSVENDTIGFTFLSSKQCETLRDQLTELYNKAIADGRELSKKYPNGFQWYDVTDEVRNAYMLYEDKDNIYALVYWLNKALLAGQGTSVKYIYA